MSIGDTRCAMRLGKLVRVMSNHYLQLGDDTDISI
jgi:hypothetical protein